MKTLKVKTMFTSILRETVGFILLKPVIYDATSWMRPLVFEVGSKKLDATLVDTRHDFSALSYCRLLAYRHYSQVRLIVNVIHLSLKNAVQGICLFMLLS